MAQPNFTAIVALIIAIVVALLLFVLYLVYFLNLDSADDYGTSWKTTTVGGSTRDIAPLGNHVYFIDARNRPSDSQVFINTPTGVPYIKRQFIIFNTSTAALEVRSGTANINPSFTDGQTYTIPGLTGVLYIWTGTENYVPLIRGVVPTTTN